MSSVDKYDIRVKSVGIRSLAVSFPQAIRTNDYWLQKFPELGIQTRQARLPKSVELSSNENGIDLWLQEVKPYLSDPFRGSVKRRVLASDESSLMLECRAAQNALKAAKLSPDEVDLAIVSSLFPKTVGPGQATHLAEQLGLRCPAWNLESTCASALIALQTAQAFLQTGVYRNTSTGSVHRILIVVSHIGSHAVKETDTLSLSMGDGAGALVVGEVKPSQGILSTKIMPTTTTHGAYVHELVIDSFGKPKIQTSTGENMSILAETAVDFVRQCCLEAVREAGVSLDEIKCFAFNTPTAWYAMLCAKALEIDPNRVINLYPLYANIGPVFPVANLAHAVSSQKIRENDLVLVYANGAAGTAAATVMRWSDVAIGSSPTETLKQPQPERPIYLTKLRDQTPSPVKVGCDLKEKLLKVKLSERESMLKAYLLEWLASLSQLSPNNLDEQICLTTMLDSLTAIAFRSQIETDLQIRVPIEKFLGENTLWHLTEFLLNQLAVAELMASEKSRVMTSTQATEREIVSF